MRPHEPEWLDLADAGQLQKVYFVYLDWPSGPVRVHSYIGSIEIDSRTWRGVGLIGSIESNGAEQVNQKPVVTLKLADTPDRVKTSMTADGAGGRAASIHVGVKDPHRDDLKLVGGLKPEFFGRIGEVDMAFQEEDDDGLRQFDYTVDIEVGRSPRLPLTYYHSDADQQRRTANHPDGPDTALRHLAGNYANPPVWTPF